MATILVVNIGSTSKKYALYQNEACVFSVRFERFEHEYVMHTTSVQSEELSRRIDAGIYSEAFHETLGLLVRGQLIADSTSLDAVGVRIVAPGSFFIKDRPVDVEYYDALTKMCPYARLHITPTLEEISHIKAGTSVPIIGVSDSAFHTTVPSYASEYAIDNEDATQYDVRRFGYHGLSVGSVVKKAEIFFDHMPERMIVCHLGGGTSITAVKEGESIDTSMGFSPTSGLIMSTRSGDIDAGALVYLGEQTGMSLPELNTYLNTESGLLGAGGHGDMKSLISAEQGGDVRAAAALQMYLYRIQKYIGAYANILGGLDAMILTGTISERNTYVRGKIVSGAASCGFTYDEEANKSLEGDGVITTADSESTAYVCETDEMQEIARRTAQTLGA